MSLYHVTVVGVIVKSTIIKVTQSSIYCVIMATTVINIIVFMIRVINLLQETVKLQASFLMHCQTFLQDSDWDFTPKKRGLGYRIVQHFNRLRLSKHLNFFTTEPSDVHFFSPKKNLGLSTKKFWDVHH